MMPDDRRWPKLTGSVHAIIALGRNARIGARNLVHRFPHAFAIVIVLVAAMWWTVAGGTLWLVHDLSSGLPDREALRRVGDMSQATTLFDAHDRPAFTIFKEQRIEVRLTQVSPLLVRAIVAVEDQRFYEHGGIDPIRVMAAALTNLRQGRAAQGGSTITQQLARQSFLKPEKTFRRKLQEVVLAARLERLFRKDEILELYLNKVYFGDGFYGVEAASLGYFGKHATEVTLPEAAMLAGLVKSPSTYAPTLNLDRAVARRAIVLQAMQETGAISQDQWHEARAAAVDLKDGLRQQEPHGQYFKEQVRLELVQLFGWDRVYQSGLRVYTTIDLEMQQAAERVLEESLTEIDVRRAARQKLRRVAVPANDPVLQGALVALDPQTAEIRALIGGRDFMQSRFNRAQQARRQAGSAFKPFVFATALEAGYSPASLIEHLDEPISTLQGAWTPEDEHSTATAMTLRAALRISSNRAAVRLLEDVGIERTVDYAKKLGIGSVPSVPSLALGSGEVTLESMAAAYAAFANGGMARPPVLIRRVEDRDGTVLMRDDSKPERAISEATAFLMATMLSDVVNFGTAYRARALGFTLPAGGKTGTTNDFVDAWFVGFTPKLLTGVWVGFDQPKTIIANGYAGDLAVPMWARFMKIATAKDKPVWFSPPEGIVTEGVCRLSGKLPSDGCYNAEVIDKDGKIEHRSLVYLEYFLRGTEPNDTCSMHPGRSWLDRVAGMFGGREEPVPARTADDHVPPPTATTSSAAVSPEEPQRTAQIVPVEKPKKKRGFWSRVFGRGRSETEKPDESKPAPRP